jgi:hypothetical protein
MAVCAGLNRRRDWTGAAHEPELNLRPSGLNREGSSGRDGRGVVTLLVCVPGLNRRRDWTGAAHEPGLNRRPSGLNREGSSGRDGRGDWRHLWCVCVVDVQLTRGCTLESQCFAVTGTTRAKTAGATLSGGFHVTKVLLPKKPLALALASSLHVECRVPVLRTGGPSR